MKSFLQVSLSAIYVTMTSSGTAVPERQIPAVSHVTTHLDCENTACALW